MYVCVKWYILITTNFSSCEEAEGNWFDYLFFPPQQCGSIPMQLTFKLALHLICHRICDNLLIQPRHLIIGDQMENRAEWHVGTYDDTPVGLLVDHNEEWVLGPQSEAATYLCLMFLATELFAMKFCSILLI